MAISAPFAKVLAAGRTQFNHRVTEARRRFPGFDTTSFAAFLDTGVDAMVSAVAAVQPERLVPVVLTAYDMALELTGQALAGPKARNPLVNQAWQDVAPQYARLIVDHPLEVLGSLSNAAVNLARFPNVRGTQWIQGMATLAPHMASLPQFQALGQFLAWRTGMAHFRSGAISAADQLPPACVLAAMGVPASAAWADIREQLLANPWWTPSGTVHPGMEIGSFSGFGGEFFVPPEVRPCQGGFVVRSGQRHFLLVADTYGAVLHAALAEDFDSESGPARHGVAAHGTRLSIDGREIALDLPAKGLVIACNEHTVAVTSPYTHAIRLWPLK
jgi:hypothetical protein